MRRHKSKDRQLARWYRRTDISQVTQCVIAVLSAGAIVSRDGDHAAVGERIAMHVACVNPRQSAASKFRGQRPQRRRLAAFVICVKRGGRSAQARRGDDRPRRVRVPPHNHFLTNSVDKTA